MHLKPVPASTTVAHCNSYICRMENVHSTVIGIKEEKRVLCVLVEQLKGTDSTEGITEEPNRIMINV